MLFSMMSPFRSPSLTFFLSCFLCSFLLQRFSKHSIVHLIPRLLQCKGLASFSFLFFPSKACLRVISSYNTMGELPLGQFGFDRGNSYTCQSGHVPSEFGCIRLDEENTVFINTNKLFWVNTGAQLVIVCVGVIEFLLGTLFFYFRHRRNEERLERSRAARQFVRVNEDGQVVEPPRKRLFSRSSTPNRPLKPVSELNGHCCGCGGTADTVLLPCKHAVCCYSCSDRATYCPFCKELCSDRQRLFAV